jgi:hypothetical protein
MENTPTKNTVLSRTIKIKKTGKKIYKTAAASAVIMPQEAPQKSIWMSMRRAPQTAAATIVRAATPIQYEGTEDISDDENDETPEAAAERLEQMKIEDQKFRDRNKEAKRLDRLESDELFNYWNRGGVFQTHTNYDYEVINTLAYPINA